MEGGKNPFLSPTQYSVRKLEKGGSVVSATQDKTFSSPILPLPSSAQHWCVLAT